MQDKEIWRYYAYVVSVPAYKTHVECTYDQNNYMCVIKTINVYEYRFWWHQVQRLERVVSVRDGGGTTEIGQK